MSDINDAPHMLELKGVAGNIYGYAGPVMVPHEKIASYEKVGLTVHVGPGPIVVPNDTPPFYYHTRALEVKLVHGKEVIVADTPANRILLDMYLLEED